MKTKALQFGKAISAALFVLLLIVAGMKNALAQNQVATLQHNNIITGVFYGQNAYSSAYDAALEGDVITLSSGTFRVASQIRKAITLRGAGCVYDSLTQVTPTIIPDEIWLDHNGISFEGIWFTGTVFSGQNNAYPNNNIHFTKCNIDAIGTYSGSSSDPRMNWQFDNCIVKAFYSYFTDDYFHGMSIINSVIRFANYYHADIFNLTTIHNSIVLFNNGQDVKNIVAYNSIIAVVSDHNVSNCNFYNCIGIKTGETSLFEGQFTQNVMEVNSYEDVFETFAGIVFYENSYQLKEGIATSFLGQDGTEVGIYGGMIPYKPRPSYMRMKRCNVASRSTIDNKLSVEIEVLTDGE